MSTEKEIGELLVEDGSVTVEWTIKDVLSYTEKDESYYSPIFSVPGSDWRLKIYPNGQVKDNSVGWISVYLYRVDDSTLPKTVSYSIDVKNMHRDVKDANVWQYAFGEASENGGVDVFEDKHTGRGFDLLQRSGLRNRMSESDLTQSGDLTFTCTLKVKDSVECTSRLNKLSQHLKDMFISKRGCDATLEVKHEKYSVHKSILTARSPVLAAMFDVDMKEKNTGSVDIVDCHPETFRDFLTYIYSAELENLSDDIFELYRIAHKYDVEGLKSDCIHRLINSLSVENFFETVILGHQFDETKLMNKTQEFFNESFREIISCDKWDSFLANNIIISNTLLKNMAEA